MNGGPPTLSSGRSADEVLLRWVGVDDRGLELEIVAVGLADGSVLVIHVMPTQLRGINARAE
jgi:hypothetical protein